ncbi:MAG: response regulator transcription factor [Candidatus Acidiferrales bacterium]
MQIRIMVADDAKIIRAAIRRVVEAHDEFVVCAEASNGAEAVAKAVEWCPDVVVMDIRMPVMNGIDAAKILAEKCPNTVVIADSVHAYKEYFDELQRVGVKGFVPKDRVVTDLVPAIDEVLHGGTWFRGVPSHPV